MKYFYFDEVPNDKGKYLLRANMNELGITNIGKSSLNVLPARLLGISYPNFLRLCRDEFGAMLVGKNQKYPTPYFSSKPEELIKLLTSRIQK